MSTIITTPARSSSTPAPSAAPRHRNVIARALGVIALGAVAWVHLADLSGKMSEVPYLGVMYIGLILGCVIAAVEVARGQRRGWLMGVGLAAATFVGFVLSRTTGLPAATEDIGNWSEALGVYSLIAEGAMVVLGAIVLAPKRALAAR